MRKIKAFRPMPADLLEDRAVPSGDGWLGSLIGVAPAADAQQVAKAYATFEKSYNTDVQTILFKSGTTPTAQRSAFNAQVATDLTTLETAVDGAITNLPTAATLTTTINGEILGTDPKATLQGELAAIKTPTGKGFGPRVSFQNQSLRDIGQSWSQVTQQVGSAPAPTGTITAATVQTTFRQVATAFQTFVQDYNTAVKNVLVPSGTTNPSANRPAFDAAVLTALQKLSTGVNAAVTTNLPALPASLATTLTNDILSTTPPASPDKSLQGLLAAEKTPTSTSFFRVLVFRVESYIDMGRAGNQVANDIISAVKTYNTSLPAV
jgi:hypothetical protein